MALLDRMVAQPPPLQMNEDGAILIAETRVPLDTIVYAFREGRTAEEIVQSYTSLALRDVYAVIAWYLTYPDEVDAYLAQREAHAETVRRENLARWPALSIRERLTARRTGTDAT
jgi:uncharacterized protein (DUF433 family)